VNVGHRPNYLNSMSFFHAFISLDYYMILTLEKKKEKKRKSVTPVTSLYYKPNLSVLLK
jgi:hypothetical protein